MGMGGWLLINQLGFLLFLRIDIWVCNRFVSPEAAGDYAAVLQWSNLIRQAGGLLSGVIGPMIMIYYARAEIENMIRLSKMAIHIFCLLLAIPIGILCTFSSSLLTIWLGESFTALAPLLVIMLCHLVINVGVLPLFSIQIALNKIKVPGVITCVMGTLNLALAVLLARFLGWGIYGVAIAGAIVLTMKNALFTPIYAALILKRPWYTFMMSPLLGLGFMASVMALAYGVSYYIDPTSLIRLVILSVIIGVIGLIGVWFVLSREERRIMVDLVPAPVRTLVTRLIPIQ